MKQVFALTLRTLASGLALAGGAWCLWLQEVRMQEIETPRSRAGDPLRQQMAPYLVVVDAGHGGHDGGAVSHGLTEKVITLDMARRVSRLLAAAGVEARLSRDADQFVPLEKRAALANELNAAAFVSLHFNTAVGSDAGVRGIETYFSARKSLSAVRQIRADLDIEGTVGIEDRRGEKLAGMIQRLVCKRVGAEDRGAKERNYTVVHHPACPAVLVECGFITHPAEAAQIKKEEHRERLAAGIAEAVCAFLHTQELKPRWGLQLSEPSTQLPRKTLAAGD